MKCSFCGNKIPEGMGKMFVKVSGDVFYFCDSKCEKNWKMKRLGKKTKWTKTYKDLREAKK